MAKTKTKKVGVTMLTVGSEWNVTSAIPVYGLESSYEFVGGSWVNRANPQQVQIRTIPAGVKIRITEKPFNLYRNRTKMIVLQVIGEIENELFVSWSDLDGRIAPGPSHGRYFIFCTQRQQYYDGIEYVYHSQSHTSGNYAQKWSTDQPKTGYWTVSQARRAAMHYTMEMFRNPQNSTYGGRDYGRQVSIELVGNIVILRCDLLTNDVLEELPVIV